MDSGHPPRVSQTQDSERREPAIPSASEVVPQHDVIRRLDLEPPELNRHDVMVSSRA
jgi:hypothetical protein